MEEKNLRKRGRNFPHTVPYHYVNNGTGEAVREILLELSDSSLVMKKSTMLMSLKLHPENGYLNVALDHNKNEFLSPLA